MNRELIKRSNEILQRDKQDLEEQQLLDEISIGNLSSTVLLGRLKLLTNKIKDSTMKKTLMNLGYMVYGISLQSKTLSNIETTLTELTETIKKQQKEIQRLNEK